MKKILCLILVVVLGSSFSGCSMLKKAVESIATPAPAEPIVIEGTNKTAELENLKITATEIETNAGNPYFIKEGIVFVGVKFEVINTSDSNQYFSTSLVEAYCDDVKTSYTFSSDFDMFESGDIAPGKKRVGYYPMEVPSDWEKIEIFIKEDILSSATVTFVFENK